MPKPVPIPDDISKPFWDAINAKKLVVQYCGACDTLQYPPASKCKQCDAGDLEWKDTSGRGHILSNMVVADGRLGKTRPDQPFNLAVITLDEDPRINFYSNMPGLAPYKVPIGAAVEVIFEEVAPGQSVAEWRIIQ